MSFWWDDERQESLEIDRKARAWQGKMIDCWEGHGNPRLYKQRDALVAALFLHHGMPDGPLPDDRIVLIEAATRRENPSREAFVTLALVEYVEDSEKGDSATLPYSLAFARSGHTLNPRTGLPGGMFRVRWPNTAE